MPHPCPSALAVARNRAAVREELRRLLPGRTDFRQSVPLGLTAIDSCLPGGGLTCGALHEIVPEPHAQPAALGFIAALLGRISSPHLWFSSPPPSAPRLHAPECKLVEEGLGVGVRRQRTSVHDLTFSHDSPPRRGKGGKLVFVLPTYGLREHGRLYGHGLSTLGLDPTRIILAKTAHRRDTLWALEEALRSGAPAAVAGFIDQLDLKTSQRLHLAATDSGLPLLLMRPATPAYGGEASAAATRWRVGTAEAARDRFGLIIRPRWHLHLERCRNGRPGEWVVEYDHVAHRFSLAAALADPARPRGANSETVGRKSHCA